jgi:hypothetical protein
MTLNPIIAAYPHVKIMEVIPLGEYSVPTWREDETQFHIEFARQTGRSIQTMQVDVQWEKPGWEQAMKAVHTYAKEQNLGFSVIYNGSATTKSDADWINSAIANIEAVEGRLQIIPDQILFTSWDPHPVYNMPETSPTAQTWLINRYVRPRSALQVQFVGQGAKGKLTTLDGKPIANTTVNGYKPGVDLRKPLPVTTVTGVVPPNAVVAIFGVRVNTECGCDGLNDLLLGTISYQETQGGSLTGSYSLPTTPSTLNGVIMDGEMVGGTRVSRIIATPTQSLTWNTGGFAVTGNAAYQFSVPAGTIGGLGWFGNIILIFWDNAGNGTRVTLTPAPARALMATAVTNPDGTFRLPRMPRAVDSPLPVTVEFDGAAGNYRSVQWAPLR